MAHCLKSACSLPLDLPPPEPINPLLRISQPVCRCLSSRVDSLLALGYHVQLPLAEDGEQESQHELSAGSNSYAWWKSALGRVSIRRIMHARLSWPPSLITDMLMLDAPLAHYFTFRVVSRFLGDNSSGITCTTSLHTALTSIRLSTSLAHPHLYPDP